MPRSMFYMEQILGIIDPAAHVGHGESDVAMTEPLWKFLSSRGEIHHGKICPVILSADKEYTFVVRKEPAM